jgi:hypothetical protein
MNRAIAFGLLGGAAAWIIARYRAPYSRRIVPAGEAVAKLQKAWADHHTTA